MSSLPASNDLQHTIADLVARTQHGELAGYDTDVERLFALLVAGVDLYVSAVLADIPTPGVGTSLGDLAVDEEVFDDPGALLEFEEVRRRRWVEVTAQALVENLVG
jgi:hypothetical protein